jgi:hypothetical protein
MRTTPKINSSPAGGAVGTLLDEVLVVEFVVEVVENEVDVVDSVVDVVDSVVDDDPELVVDVDDEADEVVEVMVPLTQASAELKH